MNKRVTVLILVVLLIGILFRLALTANGNFLFNMDSARDAVDVREMMILGKMRLTGPTTAIEGLSNGPVWYYLLSLPFILSGGDPYAAVVTQIILWVIGGFFLLKLVSKWGDWLVIPVGAIWVASNYIVLANLYSFNPTPVMLLTPLFIYLLVGYLKQEKAIFIILTWVLAGLFFNFEMNFGIFTPAIIVAGMIFTKKNKLFRQKGFWLGVGLFITTLLPQVIFDLKHQFIMTKAVQRHLSENSGASLNFPVRFQTISGSFYNTFLPTMLNHKLFAWIILGFLIPLLYVFFKKDKKEILVLVSLAYIFIPFAGYLFLPVTVNPWHLGGEMAASLILVAFLLKRLMDGGLINKIISVSLSFAVVLFGFANIGNFFLHDWRKPNLDPSLFKNEIAAIDYVYRYADGRNFKAYTYLPSIYDYPYQYLFWWYGRKKYGYLPVDYAYAPNKQSYISNKESFSATAESLKQRQNSGLVFLIKEPNRNYTRFGWEGEFVKLKSIGKQMVGRLEIEVRKELN